MNRKQDEIVGLLLIFLPIIINKSLLSFGGDNVKIFQSHSDLMPTFKGFSWCMCVYLCLCLCLSSCLEIKQHDRVTY